jgi:hypothetical protein
MKIGWIGGFAGGTLWMLALSVVRFAQGQNMHGILWGASFLFCAEVAWLFLPWRRPEIELRRLYFVTVTPVVLAAVLLLAIHSLTKGAAVWTTLPGLVVLYLPVFTLGKKTWNDIKG